MRQWISCSTMFKHLLWGKFQWGTPYFLNVIYNVGVRFSLIIFNITHVMVRVTSAKIWSLARSSPFRVVDHDLDPTFDLDPDFWPWPQHLSLTLKQDNSDVKTHMSNGSAVRAQMVWQMDAMKCIIFLLCKARQSIMMGIGSSVCNIMEHAIYMHFITKR